MLLVLFKLELCSFVLILQAIVDNFTYLNSLFWLIHACYYGIIGVSKTEANWARACFHSCWWIWYLFLHSFFLFLELLVARTFHEVAQQIWCPFPFDLVQKGFFGTPFFNHCIVFPWFTYNKNVHNASNILLFSFLYLNFFPTDICFFPSWKYISWQDIQEKLFISHDCWVRTSESTYLKTNK